MLSYGLVVCCLCVAEDLVAILDDELHGIVFGVHVGHFAFQAVIPHYRRREDYSQVLGRHLWNVSSGSWSRWQLPNIPSFRSPGEPHVRDGRLGIRDNRDAWVVAY